MNILDEYQKKYAFFHDITGVAMKVHAKYKPGLLEGAYEAALKYLLTQKGYTVQQEVLLPIYWDDVKLDKTYRMDLVVNNNIIIELKAISFIDTPQRKQLINYMNLTHMQYGMLINFGSQKLYSEWYKYDQETGAIIKVN